MSEQTTHQQVALVTGANKGIGRAAAGQLAALGMTVLTGARDPSRGEQAAAGLRAAGGDAHAVTYANELRKDGMLINAVAPGYVDTDSNNHTGFLTVAQGASVLVRLATLGADGPTAGFFSEESSVPW